jgi:Na+/melibiose symporter-like transporter
VIRPLLILVGVSVAVGTLAALPLGLVLGRGQWLCAAVGFALCVPPAALTLAIALWMSKRSKFGGLLGLACGAPVRMIVSIGGGVGLYFWELHRTQAQSPLSEPWGFWMWLLFAYLVTVAVETVLLLQWALPGPTAPAAPPTGQGVSNG